MADYVALLQRGELKSIDPVLPPPPALPAAKREIVVGLVGADWVAVFKTIKAGGELIPEEVRVPLLRAIAAIRWQIEAQLNKGETL